MSGSDGARAKGRHLLDVRVYYEDTDAGGIVYYANYLKFAERGRSELLRQAGFGHRDMMAGADGVIFAVRRCEADYLRPARLDDRVTVETGIAALSGARLTMDQVIRRGETVLVKLKVQLACIDGS